MERWHWSADWAVIDKAGTVYHNDDPESLIEKYMDLQLMCGDKEVIPIRIDHHEVIYDGDPITPEHRALIAAAPELLEACNVAYGLLTERDSHEEVDKLEVIEMLKQATAKASES